MKNNKKTALSGSERRNVIIRYKTKSLVSFEEIKKRYERIQRIHPKAQVFVEVNK